jgi:hypothetical protein
VELFSTFHPRTHPVLWRMLLVQAHLYRGIASTFGEAAGVVVQPSQALSDEERSRFDWRDPKAEETEEQAVEIPFRAARDYLDDVLGRTT